MTQAQRKEFQVERRMRRDVPEADTSNQAVLAAIKAIGEDVASLREEVRELKAAAPEQAVAKPSAPNPDDEDLTRDVRIEIAQMVRAIARTKAEIAQIKHPLAGEDSLVKANTELSAVVEATESATERILEATERCEALLGRLVTTVEDNQEVVEIANTLQDEFTRIMEACNFQDITGQRITKIVKTVRFIEDRIIAMISIWGAEAFQDLPLNTGRDDDGEDGSDPVLEGPQLGNEGISQAEIDALFD